MAERTGLAYILLAADFLVGKSLRVQYRASHRGNTFATIKLAERTGLEPATSDVTGRHSNQLNYHSEKIRLLQCLVVGAERLELPT